MKYIFILLTAATACTQQPRADKTPLQQFKEIDSTLKLTSGIDTPGMLRTPFGLKAESQARQLRQFIDSLRTQLLLQPEDDMDAAWQMMQKQQMGPVLYNRLTNYRNFITGPELPGSVRQQMKDLFNYLDNNTGAAWIKANFYQVPVVAAATLLNKFRNDVKNSLVLIRNHQ